MTQPHLMCRVPSGLYAYTQNLGVVVYYPNEGPFVRHEQAQTLKEAASWIDMELKRTGERVVAFSGKA